MSVLPLVLCGAAAALYALGGRGRRGGRTRERQWREAAFYLGVLVVAGAVEPPFDTYADSSFALHMAQHVLLMTVAPPLIVLGRPWPRMWMPFPAEARRGAARAIARDSWSAPLRWFARVFTRPPLALALMSAALGLWHVPSLYGAAVNNEWLHFLEHTCFFATAMLFWGALLDAPPVSARVGHLRRAAWFGLAAVPGWILAIVLAYASTPLYPVYAHLAHHTFGVGALGDQQLAAGIMWVPGSLVYFVAFVYSVYRWLEPEADRPRTAPRPEEFSWT